MKKNVIITGSNSGIGRQTAIELSKKGLHVVLACRSENKAKEVMDIITKDGGSCEFMPIDLNSLESVKEFVNIYSKKYDHLDTLICNAGIVHSQGREETMDGYERHFGVNYLGHFLLTLLLLPLVNKSKDGRIIILSSLAYSWTHVHFEDINLTKEYNVMIAYGQSKLCNLLFARELSRRLVNENIDIPVNAVHPGVIKSNITYNREKNKGKFLALASHIVCRSAHFGAKSSVYLATTDTGRHITGEYFFNAKVKKTKPVGNDMDSAKRLFDYSLRLLGMSWDDIKKNLVK